MNLPYLMEKIQQIIGERLAKKYTGKIVITVNCNTGGIGNAQVNCNFDIEKPNKLDNPLKTDYP